MRVIIVEPRKRPQVVEIENELEDFQNAVEGNIQEIFPWEDRVSLICNENGLFEGLPLNRNIYERGYGPIHGTFLICGITEDDYCDLSDEQVEKFTKRFSALELFV